MYLVHDIKPPIYFHETMNILEKFVLSSMKDLEKTGWFQYEKQKTISRCKIYMPHYNTRFVYFLPKENLSYFSTAETKKKSLEKLGNTKLVVWCHEQDIYFIELTTCFHEFSEYESTNFFTNISQRKKKPNFLLVKIGRW